ncbi:hypothetical protein ACRN9G_00160 [Shewanella frigidimarina]|uniref:hypothetical protein n=1 Tax=Shewanella frigidimarina TaxID=56812 RepID=UPI003D7B1FED
MRKAFIGLSTPVGFDYLNSATKTTADQKSSPNPILDSPFGLMLLFDKIIFLSKSLCPENMRNLSFVECLDEQGTLPLVTKDEIDLTISAMGNNKALKILPGLSFQDSVFDAGVFDGMGVDNHTHSLKIGNYQGFANSDANNLAIDLLYLSKLNDSSIELITNSRLRLAQNATPEQWTSSKLTELLVIENISNYLTPSGPYHPIIDEVRENKYLNDFRKWAFAQNGSASLLEVKEMKAQVEHALQEAQEELFLKHLDPKRHFKTVGEAMIGDLAGLIYPVAGTTKALCEVGKEIIKPSINKWQGFVVGAKRELRSKYA